MKRAINTVSPIAKQSILVKGENIPAKQRSTNVGELIPCDRNIKNK
ncbi:hypothetical protein M2135_000126 [Parabacteroides sp. PF5-9]|nr:hypothetical protein [Parabacteroides sp. PF5-9]